MRDLNFSTIIVETIASFTIASIINSSIKIKILYLDKIYLYKNNSKEKYLR